MDEILQRLEKLESKVFNQTIQIGIMRSLLAKEKPDWADESLIIAKEKGLVEFPFMGVDSDGSYDFYRIIDLLHKNGLI